MGMPDLVRRWTRAEVLALPDDGKRYELFDGELLVTPAPTGLHQVALAKLLNAIAPYVTAHGLGQTLWSPADLDLGGDQLSQPDLFVVPFLPPDRDWRKFPTPNLIVEVLSPSTARADRTVKRRRFSGSAFRSIGLWTSMPARSSAGGRAMPDPSFSTSGWSGIPRGHHSPSSWSFPVCFAISGGVEPSRPIG